MAPGVIKRPENLKKIILSNVFYLIGKLDLRVGEVEEQIGVSTGYLSRLNKDDKSTKISLDLVFSLSEVLGVPLDMLCSVDMAASTPNDLKAIRFVEQLAKETSLGSRRWDKESLRQLSEIRVFANGNTDHPLYKSNHAGDACFNSSFAIKNGTRVINDMFSTNIGNDNWVYVVNVHYPDEKGSDFEVYMCQYENDTYDGYHCIEVHPVCASAPGEETGLSSALRKLYSAVAEVNQHVQFNNYVLTAIDEYLNPKPVASSDPTFIAIDSDELPF